jgi:DNA-binding beta-propeller fold protein YncE
MKSPPLLLLFFLLIQFGFSQNTAKKSLMLEVVPDFFQTPVDGNFIQPTGVAVNSRGHVFVFNKGNRQLMEFDATGRYIRSLGHGLFKDPHGLRIDADDNIWVTDLEANLVIKMSPEGKVQMVLGENGTSGLYNEARDMINFFKPADVAFGRNGNIYIADGYGNHRVARLDKNGKLIRTWGEQGPEPGNFDNPHNIVVDHQGRVYVADRNNARIQVFSAEGDFLEEWTGLGKPWGLALSPERNLYMTDGDAEKILKLDLNGHILAEFNGGPGSRYGQFRAAHGIAAGPQEELYVTEVLNWRVQKLVQHWEKGDWHRIHTANTAHRRHESAFVELGGKLYAIGGRNTRKVDIYDPETNTWSRGADAPLEMHHFQAVSYNGEIWVVGAFTGPYPMEEPVPFIYVYNPSADRWRSGGKLPEGRHRGAAGLTVYQDKFYLLCGNTLGHYTGHNTWFDEFDPATGQWTSLPDAPHTRDHFQLAVIDGKLYAAGGRNTSQKTGHVMDQTVPEVDVYDFAAGAWSTLPESAHLPTLRAGTTSIVLGNQLIVMGGESATQVPAHNEVEAYEVSTGKWKTLPPMLQGRHGTQAVLYDGKVYIAGGSSDRGGGPELNSIDCWEVK